jgi:D-glycero-beta-D-manno-heptose-7-phosphate kinase
LKVRNTKNPIFANCYDKKIKSVDKDFLAKALSSFKQFRVAVIGDVMIDSYMWGRVDRISPEAPVPVIASTRHENRIGGAANVALNVQSLGAMPILCSVIGDDENKKLFLDLLQRHQLTTEGIIPDSERITTIKTRVIAGNQQMLRIDEETDKPLSETMESIFVKKLKNIIVNKDIHSIIFEDYDKGVITPKIIKEVVALANEMGIPTFVDPKRRNFLSYQNVTLFKPNFKELVEGLKIEANKGDVESLHRAAQILHKEMNVNTVMVTLSEKGIFFSNSDGYLTLPAEVRDIADVSGAGDTVISTACLCWLAGIQQNDIAMIANLAGGLVCEKVGVVPIDKKQLEIELALHES